MTDTSEISNILHLIADGTPFKVVHLHEDQYQVLVTNDNYERHQDLGVDPFYSLIITGPA